MSVVNKLISILNRREMGGSGKKSDSEGDPKPKNKKVKDTGLVLYESNEKTPTGQSNSFSASGLTSEDLIAYAKKYNLPTTSNKEFQQAQYDLFNSTPEGRKKLEEMAVKYGQPRAGKYADGYLGARTLDMMMSSPEVVGEQDVDPRLPEADIIRMERVPLQPVNLPNQLPVEAPVVKVPTYLTPKERKKFEKENEKYREWLWDEDRYDSRPQWGDFGAYGGLGYYDKNGNPPSWWNLGRNIKAMLEARAVRRELSKPQGNRYGGIMSEDTFLQLYGRKPNWWKNK